MSEQIGFEGETDPKQIAGLLDRIVPKDIVTSGTSERLPGGLSCDYAQFTAYLDKSKRRAVALRERTRDKETVIEIDEWHIPGSPVRRKVVLHVFALTPTVSIVPTDDWYGNKVVESTSLRVIIDGETNTSDALYAAEELAAKVERARLAQK